MLLIFGILLMIAFVIAILLRLSDTSLLLLKDTYCRLCESWKAGVACLKLTFRKQAPSLPQARVVSK